MTFSFVSFLSALFRCHRLVALGLLLAVSGPPAQAATDDPDINLRLFGKNVIEEYDGCRLAFWQATRDPQKDAYSYVFFAPFNDGEELPGWMKIDDTVFLMNREDRVSVTTQAMEPLRLYRTSKGSYTALIEVLEQHVEGNNILVDKGQMTITRTDHYPFVITVKGGIICPSQPKVGSYDRFDVPDGLLGDAISLDPPQTFSDLSAVPQGILDTVARDAPACRPGETTGSGARYAISDAMTLWELPCLLYPNSWSNVYVTALNETPAYSNVLFLPGVPDHGDLEGRYELLSPEVTPEQALVFASSYGTERNCGHSERYQLRAVEGEALEFVLLEYREKLDCSGPEMNAASFPIVYRAK